MPGPDAPRDAALGADLELIRAAAVEGGAIAMRFFNRSPEVWMKGGTSPVSEADYAVDRFLLAELGAARPDYGWLSEETADTPERLAMERSFIVDPIDGTRGFLEGSKTWCVSVAVVEKGRPLAGVLACPATGEVFTATAGGGAWLGATRLRTAQGRNPPSVAGPKPMVDAAAERLGRIDRAAYIPSLAYRIAKVAAGRIDATFVKPNAHDWDLAAADLILSEADGAVVDPAGRPLAYGGADPRHGALLASGAYLLDKLAEVLAETSQ